MAEFSDEELFIVQQALVKTKGYLKPEPLRQTRVPEAFNGPL